MTQDPETGGRSSSTPLGCSGGTGDGPSPRGCQIVCNRAHDLPRGLLRSSSKQDNAWEVLRKHGLRLQETNMKAHGSPIGSAGSSSPVYVEETRHSTPKESFSEEPLVTAKDQNRSPSSEKSTVSGRSASENDAASDEDPVCHNDDEMEVERIETGMHQVKVWAGPLGIAESSAQLNDSAQHTKKEVNKLLRVASGNRNRSSTHGMSSLFCLNLCTTPSNQDTSSIIDMFSDSTMERSDCRGWSLRDWMPSMIPKYQSKEGAITDDATASSHPAGKPENSGDNSIPRINMPKNCRVRAMDMPGGLPPISEDGTCLIEAEREAMPLTSARFASPMQTPTRRGNNSVERSNASSTRQTAAEAHRRHLGRHDLPGAICVRPLLTTIRCGSPEDVAAAAATIGSMCHDSKMRKTLIEHGVLHAVLECNAASRAEFTVPVIQALLEGDSTMQQSGIRSSACALTVVSEVLHFAFSSNLPAERAWILAGLAIPKEVIEECSERLEELVAYLVQKWDLQDLQADRKAKEDVFAPYQLEPELRQWFSVFSVGAVACVLTCCWVACMLIKAQAAASFSDEQHKKTLEIDVIQKLLQAAQDHSETNQSALASMLVARVCEQPAGAQAMLRCGIPARLNKTVLHELAVQLTRPDGCPTVQQMWDAEGGEALVAAMREGDLQEYWLALSLLTYIARRSPAWAESVAGLVGLSEALEMGMHNHPQSEPAALQLLAGISTAPEGSRIAMEVEACLHFAYQAIRRPTHQQSSKPKKSTPDRMMRASRELPALSWMESAQVAGWAADIVTGIAKHVSGSALSELRTFVPVLLQLVSHMISRNQARTQKLSTQGEIASSTATSATAAIAAISANPACHNALLQYEAVHVMVVVLKSFCREEESSQCITCLGASASDETEGHGAVVWALTALTNLSKNQQGLETLVEENVVSACASVLQAWTTAHYAGGSCRGSNPKKRMCPTWAPCLAALMGLLKSLTVAKRVSLMECMPRLAPHLSMLLQLDWGIAADAATVLYAMAEDRDSAAGAGHLVKTHCAMSGLVKLAERAIVEDPKPSTSDGAPETLDTLSGQHHRNLEEDRDRQRAAVYAISTLGAVSGSLDGGKAAGEAGAAKVAALCLRWQLNLMTGAMVMNTTGTSAENLSDVSEPRQAELQKRPENKTKNQEHPISNRCVAQKQSLISEVFVCAHCLGTSEKCLFCHTGKKCAPLVPSAPASVSTLRNLARLNDGPQQLVDASALRPLVIAAQFGDCSLRGTAVAALSHARRSDSALRALAATKGVAASLLGTIQEEGSHTAVAAKAGALLAKLVSVGGLSSRTICQADGFDTVLCYVKESIKAQAGVQRALQLLLVVIGGCGANELDKVSDGSVVAVLVDAARLPQAPCKQLALQTLSKILSAKPDETCAVFHTLGGTSIAMEVIRAQGHATKETLEASSAAMRAVAAMVRSAGPVMLQRSNRESLVELMRSPSGHHATTAAMMSCIALAARWPECRPRLLADQGVAAAACQALQIEAPVPVEAICAGVDLLGLVAQDSKGCSILSGMTARMRQGLSNVLQALVVSQRSSSKESVKKGHPTPVTEKCSRQGPALVKDPETLGAAIREKQQLGLGDSIINMIESLYVNMDESLPRLFSARALDSLAAILNNACDRCLGAQPGRSLDAAWSWNLPVLCLVSRLLSESTCTMEETLQRSGCIRHLVPLFLSGSCRNAHVVEAEVLICRILATLAKDHDAANEINSLGGPSVLQRLISANTPISTNRFPNKLIAADAVNANSSWVCRRDTSWADSEVSFPRDDFSNVAACNELFGEQWDPTNEQVEELGIGIQMELRRCMLDLSTALCSDRFHYSVTEALTHRSTKYEPRQELNSASIETPSHHVAWQHPSAVVQQLSPVKRGMPKSPYRHQQHCGGGLASVATSVESSPPQNHSNSAMHCHNDSLYADMLHHSRFQTELCHG